MSDIVNSYILGVKQAKFNISQKNMFPLLNFDDLVKSMILPAQQAILEFMTRLLNRKNLANTLKHHAMDNLNRLLMSFHKAAFQKRKCHLCIAVFA